MTYSTWLAFPPLVALIISMWLIVNADKRNLLKNNLLLSLFLSGIVGLNTIELSTYTGITDPNLFLMKLYYVFMIITLASVLSLTIKISNIPVLQKNHESISKAIVLISLAYTYLILGTSSIISGFEYISYSITRTPGNYYFLIQLLFLLFSFPILLLLVAGSSWKIVDENVKRCRLILVSFSPLLISLLTVLGLMEFGFKVNAAIVLPIGTTFLLLAIINTERKQDLFKLLIKIPYTSENLSYRKITDEIENFLTSARCGTKSSLKDLTSSLEQQIVSMAVEISNGSQVKAAALLNTSTSSICRKKVS